MQRHNCILNFKTALFHFCTESFFSNLESYGVGNLQDRFAGLRSNTCIRSSSPKETECLMWRPRLHVCMSVSVYKLLDELFHKLELLTSVEVPGKFLFLATVICNNKYVTPQSRALLDRSPGAPLLRTIPVFCGTRSSLPFLQAPPTTDPSIKPHQPIALRYFTIIHFNIILTPSDMSTFLR